jgi:PPOX class probable FMN-dependent enzyme
MSISERLRARFQAIVEDEAELRTIIRPPGELVVRKQLSALDAHCRAFIAAAPFVLVATADAAGRCDVSPRGDAPGFVLVHDPTTLIIPDRPGNRRVDTLRNLLVNPQIGLLFVIPGVEETLRVNGQACIIRDEAVLERCEVQGKRPLLAIAVEVQEAFVHCAKAFKRSQLWRSEHWPAASPLPSLGRVLMDQTRLENTTAVELDCAIEDNYREQLY